MNFKGIKEKEYTCKGCAIVFPFKGYGSQNIYCSISCNKEFRANKAEERFREQYESWLNGGTLDVLNPRKLIKRFVTLRDGHICCSCKNTEWLDEPITLWCDHIDGDASNNKPANFRLICPNCDSKSPTFGAKNYGKGRKSRGLPQYG